MNYWTLDAFEEANIKEIEIDGKNIKIKALDPKFLMTVFNAKDTNEEMSLEEILESMDKMDEIVVNGLVEPAVTKATVARLGRYRQKIASAIIKFSGVTDEGEDKLDSFPEESADVDG